jgi:uncharacterized phage infection (PIP) family protein YhgE
MLMPRPAPPPRAIGVNLVLFFAFALAALVLLTHILVDVAQARTSVAETVRPAVAGIEADTALLPDLARTSRLTERLATAAQHVNDSLTDVVGSTLNIDATIVRVRSDSASIARSVSSIAGSAATISSRLDNLDADISSIDDRAGQTTADYAAASRAVASLPDGLRAAAANVRALARLIPSITKQASAIVATLTEVDGHLVNINANGIIRLTNLLQLSNLLGASTSNGPNR